MAIPGGVAEGGVQDSTIFESAQQESSSSQQGICRNILLPEFYVFHCTKKFVGA